MKAIIIGAGELGRLLASTLCAENHDVVVIDSSSENFERLKEKLDLMVIEGSCSDVSILKQAGIQSCDTLIAVSGDEAANILACKIAGKFGVKKNNLPFLFPRLFLPRGWNHARIFRHLARLLSTGTVRTENHRYARQSHLP